jgi:uncharacterized RDD family membrane protein YckC
VGPGGQRLAEFTAVPDDRLASFADRLVARIIDVAILGAASAVVIVPIYVIAFFTIFRDFGTTVYTERDRFGRPTTPTPDPFAVLGPVLAVMALVVLLSWLLSYLYEVELMFRSGQTIGKRVMKIKVVPLDPAQALTRGQAFKRFLVPYVAAGLVPGLGLVDGLWQLWDQPYRQCLHDKFARTVVMRLNP